MNYLTLFFTLLLIIFLGFKILTGVLDRFGFGPNVPTRQEIINENIRILEDN